MNNYLVVLASYINTDTKRDIVVDTLKHLKEQNIDVCMVMHSNQYLNDVVKYVKYLYYDYDNEYVDIQDFYTNTELLNDKNCSIGFSNVWLAGNDWNTRIHIKPEYSRCALSLLRNGSIISHINNYDWVVYLEYDIPVPSAGYKKLIEDKINILNRDNKNCFFFKELTMDLPVWPAIMIFNSNKLYNSYIVKDNWYSSKINWINFWGNTGFEFCIEHIINNVYPNDSIFEIITEKESSELWNTTDHINLSRSYQSSISLSNFIVHIYPQKNENKYDLQLVIFNTQMSAYNTIYDVLVEYDDNVVFSIDKMQMGNNCYRIYSLPDINLVKKVRLSYQLIGKHNKTEEFFYVKDLEKIHKYVLNFNSIK